MKFYKLIFSFSIVIFLIGCMISNGIAGNEKLSAPNNLVAWQSGEYIQLRYDFDYEEQYEYNIYRSPNLGGEWEKLNFIPFPLNNFVDYHPLVYETSYYKVVRIDYYGNESFPSIIKVQYDLTKIGICIKGIFDKNNIISDQQLINFSSMSLWDIQNFLSDHGSYLATYYFNSRSAAQHIYDACQEHQISPQVVLTTLQKEQGLITSSSATQAQLNWAMGWDGSSDFGTQIYWGTKQFRRYYDDLGNYGWSVGVPHTVNDGVITPANIATAGLYIYTPWIGEGGGGAYGVGGNYLFWDLWYNTFSFGSPTSDNPPVVNFISISNPSITVGDYFTISYSVSDDVGLSWVELWRTNDKNGQPDENGWTQLGPQYSISGKSYSGEFYDSPSSPGVYWYGIHVGDTGVNWATETNPVKGTVTSANQPPTLSSGSVSPSSGTTSTTFIYSVNYYDPDGDSPAIRWVYIYTGGWSSHNMTLSSGSASNGTYTYSTNLSTGTHYYYFYFDDGTHAVWLPAAGSYYTGPTVDNPPSITVTSPTNGTVWNVGETRSITWTVSGDTSNIDYFLLAYSIDGGNNYDLVNGVNSTAPGTARTYSWAIPNTPSPQCKILIGAIDANGNSLTAAASEGLFAITQAIATRIISLSGDLNFSNVQVGTTSTKTLTISNTGNSTLTVYGINCPTGFSGNWSGTIFTGNSQNVTITFSPTQPITYSENLTVNSDATSGVNTKLVSGTGVPLTYPPQVITNDASSITSISVQLNGNLDSIGGLSCQVWFEYGKTTSYGSSTPKQSKSSTGSFNQAISSLDPNTIYHFRACASKDLIIFALAYNTTPGDPKWNPICDLNSDGAIGFPDLIIFAMHYGDVCAD